MLESMVVVYGTVCLDRLRQVPSVPSLGGYVEIQDERLALGGEAANSCAALASWGADCRLVGNSLGDDSVSSLIEELLSEAGLGSALFPTRSHPAPFCDIYITPEGERTMFGLGFIDMETRHGYELIPWETAEWLTVDDNHGSAARTAVTLANEKGLKVYTLDFCRPNEPLTPETFWQSSSVWTDTREDPVACMEWLARFVEEHQCRSVLTDGAAGFYYSQPGVPPTFLPSYPCPAPLDSTGAGDAFRAGMLYGLSNNLPLGDCFSLGSAAGSLSCTRLGGAANAPTLAEIQNLIQSHPEISKEHQRFS